MKKALVAVGVLVAVFLVGYLPARLELRKAREETARLQLELGLARLQVKLGLIGYEIERSNFANASALSTEFFDGLRGRLRDPALAGDASAAARKAALEEVAARRDELTTDLARADPGARDKVAKMYERFSQATGIQPPAGKT